MLVQFHASEFLCCLGFFYSARSSTPPPLYPAVVQGGGREKTVRCDACLDDGVLLRTCLRRVPTRPVQHIKKGKYTAHIRLQTHFVVGLRGLRRVSRVLVSGSSRLCVYVCDIVLPSAKASLCLFFFPSFPPFLATCCVSIFLLSTFPLLSLFPFCFPLPVRVCSCLCVSVCVCVVLLARARTLVFTAHPPFPFLLSFSHLLGLARRYLATLGVHTRVCSLFLACVPETEGLTQTRTRARRRRQDSKRKR